MEEGCLSEIVNVLPDLVSIILAVSHHPHLAWTLRLVNKACRESVKRWLLDRYVTESELRPDSLFRSMLLRSGFEVKIYNSWFKFQRGNCRDGTPCLTGQTILTPRGNLPEGASNRLLQDPLSLSCLSSGPEGKFCYTTTTWLDEVVHFLCVNSTWVDEDGKHLFSLGRYEHRKLSGRELRVRLTEPPVYEIFNGFNSTEFAALRTKQFYPAPLLEESNWVLPLGKLNPDNICYNYPPLSFRGQTSTDGWIPNWFSPVLLDKLPNEVLYKQFRDTCDGKHLLSFTKLIYNPPDTRKELSHLYYEGFYHEDPTDLERFIKMRARWIRADIKPRDYLEVQWDTNWPHKRSTHRDWNGKEEVL